MKKTLDLNKAQRDANETAQFRQHLQERMNEGPASSSPGRDRPMPLKLTGQKRPILAFLRKPVSPFDLDTRQVHAWLDEVVRTHPARFPKATEGPRATDEASRAPGQRPTFPEHN